MSYLQAVGARSAPTGKLGQVACVPAMQATLWTLPQQLLAPAGARKHSASPRLLAAGSLTPDRCADTRIAALLSHCCTSLTLLHFSRIAAPLSHCCTSLALLHFSRIAAPLSPCYSHCCTAPPPWRCSVCCRAWAPTARLCALPRCLPPWPNLPLPLAPPTATLDWARLEAPAAAAAVAAMLAPNPARLGRLRGLRPLAVPLRRLVLLPLSCLMQKGRGRRGSLLHEPSSKPCSCQVGSWLPEGPRQLHPGWRECLPLGLR